jgi:integrase
MSNGSPFKRCGCRDPETRRKYPEGKCPDLEKRDHGAWWARYSAPRDPNGKRRQPRLGPFRTKTDAEKALRKALTDQDEGAIVLDRTITVAQYLPKWLAAKSSLADSTRESYQEAIDLYFIPAFGPVKMIDLRERHLEKLYEAIGQINNLPEGEKPSELLRRLLAARALAPWKHEREGQTPGLNRKKPLKASRIHRIHRVLSSALGTAYRQKLIGHNPAPNVELPSAKKPRPIPWTPERVARWQQTGRRPGPVMVWTPAQCGEFLDFTEARGDRLHPLWHLTATRGLRRGEGCGALWEHSDLDGRPPSISFLEDEEDEDITLKTESSWRTVMLDASNVALLKAWRAVQAQERLAAGASWVDSGRIFTRPDGSPLRPDRVSERFGELVRMAGLPPIRFHDLRHCAATLMLKAGQDMKVVSATLGHSRYSFTADTYGVVLPELMEAAAEATVAMIPRAGVLTKAAAARMRHRDAAGP